MPRTIKGPYLITTSPTLTECHTCHRPVLAATVDGLDRHLDSDLLNPMGELAALLAGRSTYTLIGDQLLVRSPALIGSGRFDGRPVLADHDHTATPDLFVDKVLAPRAVTLIVAAVGGVVVGGRDDAPAPF